MLIHPAAIVALVLYLIVGPLTIPERFQARLRSLGHGVHQKFSSVLSLPRAGFEPQDYPVVFEATTAEALPIAPVETDTIHPVDVIPSCPIPLEDYVGVVVSKLYPMQDNDHPSPAPVRVFVVSSKYQGPFDWRDLFNYQVLDVLTVIYFSIWFPSVVIYFVAKLLSRSESLDEVRPPVDTPKPLPPKVLPYPTTAQIQINSKSHAPLEPISTPAPPETSTFWIAPERKKQDQSSSPSPLLLGFLEFSALESESQKRLSPLSSPADSGYGTTLPDIASDASCLVSGENLITTPEHLFELLHMADVESTLVHDSPNVATSSDNSTGEKVDTSGFDTELEDDDDGSTTVTNSIANLADLNARSAPIPAETLATKLESVAATLIEEAKSLSEPFVDEPPVTIPPSDDSVADLPSHDEPVMSLPSDHAPATDSGTAIQGPVMEKISVDIHTPSKPSDVTDTVANSVRVDKRTATDTSLETITEEDDTLVEDDLPSQDNPEQDVEPWSPDYEVPTITISPPSDVDPEDFAQQLDSEDDEGSEDVFGPYFEDELEPESEYDDESEPKYADDYLENSAAEVVPELPLSPVEVSERPFRSPIAKTGKLWSDDEGGDLDPPPFSGEISHVEVFDNLEGAVTEGSDAAEITKQPEVIDAIEQTEAQDSPVEEISDIVAATSEDLNTEEPVTEVVQPPVEKPQPALEAPAQEVDEPTPVEPVPSSASGSHPVRTQTLFDNGDHDEGGNRSDRTLEIPRPSYYHCCKLYKSDGRPKSWKTWKIEKPAVCIPKKTNLQKWQFVRPTDKDGENPTTRIAIDNLDAEWFLTVDGISSYNYLTEAMGFFPTRSFRCWRGRVIDGVEYSSIGYATVDFDSIDDAIRMFDELQGRRLRGHTWHWRLEFVNPHDDTHGGRKVIRTELVPDSVKQALAAELAASTRRHVKSGRLDDASNGTAVATRPSAKVRPQLSIGGRSLFTGVMSNVMQERRTEERPARSTTRLPPRRPHRS